MRARKRAVERKFLPGAWLRSTVRAGGECGGRAFLGRMCLGASGRRAGCPWVPARERWSLRAEQALLATAERTWGGRCAVAW
jgi:hypothetical protein